LNTTSLPMAERLTPGAVLPEDNTALLVGRAWVPGRGAVLVRVTHAHTTDLSALAPTCAALLELPGVARLVAEHVGARLGSTADILANSTAERADASSIHFMAPNDLQAIKAAGVTFVSSMLERVIEEQAKGDPSKAETVRKAVVAVIGDNLATVVPGSAEAAQLKYVLVQQQMWSQYLEVGIGPDAEIFTKAQPMSAVGVGADIGIHPKSVWNNPEPEIVLAVNSRCDIVGATLGNDVNLRDFEGRSALLLSKAKDNNASAAIGPFIRLFDTDCGGRFSLDTVRQCDLAVRVEGPDGFVMQGGSSIGKISRDPADLAQQALNANHQYPDGFVLYLGTMFAPTQDRPLPGRATGEGFTHLVGDRVSVSTPELGCLVNRVQTSDKIAPWTYGVSALMKDLARQGLLRGA
jgi:fumarylacetoacetate (FAA) hydrolase family protein